MPGSRSSKEEQRTKTDYANIQKKFGVSAEDLEYHKQEGGKKAGAIKRKHARTGHVSEAHKKSSY